ncbi:MAG: transglutaminase-like domain-containing protein [Verrucomicrobiota bacterium]|nr:transglutaminase-like domain-containing protein [Verrucomicrobiota bacterium]
MATTKGITLEELRNDQQLTPERFASQFASFAFVFRAEVQTPELFLSTRAGDCDDYSTLAAVILREKGYTPRLISVRMKKEIHVVCYIEETKSYLDYNLRAQEIRMVPCEPDLGAIANKVAKSFKSSWRSVSEFTFEADRQKRLVSTVKAPKGLFASAGF